MSFLSCTSLTISEVTSLIALDRPHKIFKSAHPAIIPTANPMDAFVNKASPASTVTLVPIAVPIPANIVGERPNAPFITEASELRRSELCLSPRETSFFSILSEIFRELSRRKSVVISVLTSLSSFATRGSKTSFRYTVNLLRLIRHSMSSELINSSSFFTQTGNFSESQSLIFCIAFERESRVSRLISSNTSFWITDENKRTSLSNIRLNN
mmetsp:Transcript_62911/g.72185  ORF Transcript_62911/g.72185 Transcript_62911/m.72185 type:complete len:212 (+) Transcript_62911:381-1016(+)